MGVTPEKVLRRVRGLIGTSGNERSNTAITRLVLRAVLFDNQPVPAWREDAACAEIGAEVFYPELSQAADAVAAKRVCAGCPVCAACLADVLDWETTGRRYGVVGGLTPTERSRLVADRRRERSGEVAAWPPLPLGCGGCMTAARCVSACWITAPTRSGRGALITLSSWPCSPAVRCASPAAGRPRPVPLAGGGERG